MESKSRQGKFRVEAPSNIALVKYWGKKGYQLPQNPSISFALTNCKTIMDVEYSFNPAQENFLLDFYFEGSKNPVFEERILAKIVHLPEKFSFIKNIELKINGLNTFPHSSGIASSASSMACLSLVLSQIYHEVTGDKVKASEVSDIARRFSGSASRSLFPGYCVWGKTPMVENSCDEYAVPLNMNDIHESFRDLKNAVIVIDKNEKKVSTSAGHDYMDSHPYSESRYQYASAEFNELFLAMKAGDWETFHKVCRSEAFQLHAMMMTSQNPYTLLKPNSIAVIDEIDTFIREQTNLPLTYTLDAGPNIHLIYPSSHQTQVEDFLIYLDEHKMFEHIISDGILKELKYDFLSE
ncbi:MAG: diphosphomevalonate decarboxylase [Halobacteriovoraceae bacterium]|nr:diphosphomevalonate decarboxylase [Halobacteriovoraceae bacterium]